MKSLSISHSIAIFSDRTKKKSKCLLYTAIVQSVFIGIDSDGIFCIILCDVFFVCLSVSACIYLSLCNRLFGCLFIFCVWCERFFILMFLAEYRGNEPSNITVQTIYFYYVSNCRSAKSLIVMRLFCYCLLRLRSSFPLPLDTIQPIYSMPHN